MGKSKLSEEDIKARYITPAIQESGWDLKTNVRFEYSFTDGRIRQRGNVTLRGQKKRVDYLLSFQNNYPVAIIEAKKNTFSMGAGLQQAICYAEALDIKYVYSSNGDGFIEQNLFTGEVKELKLNEFPSPEELRNRYLNDMKIGETEEKVISEPYYYEPNYKIPRYYQRIAINRTVEKIAKGQDRAILVCATGNVS